MASHGGNILFAPIIGEMIPFFKGFLFSGGFSQVAEKVT